MGKGVGGAHVGGMGWISGGKEKERKKERMDWKIIIF